jgi:hypothetical protein
MENKEIKKKSFWKSKMFLFAILPLFVIGLVLAGGYIVSTLTLTIGVGEPFTVQYAIIGDASTYTGGTCANESLTWFNSTSTSIPTGNFYPMESRAVCVKITNAGEVAIPYTINSTVTNDNQNSDCANAFGLPNTLTGSALHGVNYDGKVIQILANATPVSGCNIVISVLRG